LFLAKRRKSCPLLFSTAAFFLFSVKTARLTLPALLGLSGKMMHVEKFASQNFVKIAAPLAPGMHKSANAGENGPFHPLKITAR